MQTILSVRVDTEVKVQAQDLANHLGIPLSTVIDILLKSFIESGEIILSREPKLSPFMTQELNRVIKNIQPKHILMIDQQHSL